MPGFHTYKVTITGYHLTTRGTERLVVCSQTKTETYMGSDPNDPAQIATLRDSYLRGLTVGLIERTDDKSILIPLSQFHRIECEVSA